MNNIQIVDFGEGMNHVKQIRDENNIIKNSSYSYDEETYPVNLSEPKL